MENLRTKKRADLDTDHQLVVAKTKLKLKKHWKVEQPALLKLTTESLPGANRLRKCSIAALSNKSQVLQDLQREERITKKNNWKWIKEEVTKTY